MTEVEITQFLVVMRAWCIGMSEMQWAHEHKALDDETYQTSVKALQGMFSRPGARAFWQTYKPTATPSFVRLVEGILAAAPMARPIHNVDEWKSIIARQAQADSVAPSPAT